MIGFFDSGVGGLTVQQEVVKRLPSYSTIYLGDNARSPYGTKTHEELVQYTWEGVQWLFAQGAELVIVACNSASASALREIQQTKLPLLTKEGVGVVSSTTTRRVLGVIRPTVEELVKRGFDDIAVLSTEATKKSEAYPHEIHKLNPNAQVVSFACPTWASMIEAGKAGTEEMAEQVGRDMEELKRLDPDVKAVLLACTHYPYVKADVELALGPDVTVFDQGKLVAESLEDYLDRHPEIEQKLDRTQKATYYTTGDSTLSTKVAQEAFGFVVTFEHVDLQNVLKNL